MTPFQASRALVAAAGLAAGLAAGPAHAQLDWSGYDRLLRAHVREGVVDYAGFAAGRPVLTKLVSAIATADPKAEGDRPAQLAAWLNAYNALVIEAVLQGKSPGTLLGRFGFFMADRRPVFGQAMTLHAMENAHVRAAFPDARIHFALVCASRSCPKLRSEAYAGPRLGAQLDDQARWFLASAERNRFEPATRTARLSPIFQWYAADFERDAGSVPRYVQRFAPPAARAWVAAPGTTIAYLDYDWSLNGRR